MIYKVTVTTVIDQARETCLVREKTRIQLFADYIVQYYVCALIPFV